jgi:hypothetical protein
MEGKDMSDLDTPVLDKEQASAPANETQEPGVQGRAVGVNADQLDMGDPQEPNPEPAEDPNQQPDTPPDAPPYEAEDEPEEETQPETPPEPQTPSSGA